MKEVCLMDDKKQEGKYNRYHIDKYIDDYKNGYNPITLEPVENFKYLKNAKCRTEKEEKKIWKKL